MGTVKEKVGNTAGMLVGLCRFFMAGKKEFGFGNFKYECIIWCFSCPPSTYFKADLMSYYYAAYGRSN